MDLVYMYLKNLGKRVVKGQQVNPKEIGNLPKLIDRTYGDGDGVLEMQDLADAAVEIGGNIVDKVELVADKIGDILDWIF